MASELLLPPMLEARSRAMAAGLLIVLVLSYLVFSIVKNQTQRKHQLPLPPKPPGIYLLGNLVEMIKAAKNDTVHLLMKRLADEHGEIFRFQVGPVTEYFLNSDQAVKVRTTRADKRGQPWSNVRSQALLDRSSAQTSERPRWIVSNEQICNKLNVLLLDASDPRWKVF